MIKYCKSIGLTAPYLERTEALYEMINEAIKDEFVDIFIEDYIEQEGTRIYSCVSFFGKRFYAEIEEFLTKDEIVFCDINMIAKAIRVKKQDYDFKKATEKSRLNIDIIFDFHTTANLKASKENCDFLWNIINKYFIPCLETK